MTALGLVLALFVLNERSPETYAQAPEPLLQPLKLTLRYRVQPVQPNGDVGRFEVREKIQQWIPRKTAIIICDMWDLHHCKRAVDRVKEMAPRMNDVVTRAREQGVFIIHAPSECMAAYENTPMRQRAKNAPAAKNLPKDIGTWCNRIPAEEKGVYPIDQSDGGEDDEQAEHAAWAAKLTALGRNPRAPWKSEIDILKKRDQDAISDSGVEVWNLLEERGIEHVILMGVHTNMCVLGRPFGLRQMAKNGKDVVLMRDMTDTMYNPARWPYVSHFKGTDLIVEHIEKFVCPTITSDQILGGKPFAFQQPADPWLVFEGAKGPGKGKHIVLVSGDEEYRSEEALPQLAKILGQHHGFRCTVLFAIDRKDGTINPDQRDNIPGLGALDSADLMIIATRFRDLPDEQMKHIVDYVEAGKPIIGLRTATHAFDLHGSKTYARYTWTSKEWDGGFGRQVLGETWISHHGQHGKQSTKGILTASERDHPILRGLKDGDLWGPTDVYGVRLPLPGDSKTLVLGQVLKGMKPSDEPVEGAQNEPMMPIAWTKSYTTASGKTGKAFTTTMGASQDLLSEGLRRLLVNACYWGLSMEDQIEAKASVDLVGKYHPRPFGFGGSEKGRKPADYALK
jgi:nicotinamidase-related amidase